MPRALRVCPVPGCPELTTGGRCAAHRREVDRQRGSAAERGYTGAGHRRFRAGVLSRDPLCVCTLGGHGHGRPCSRPATVADHWPRSRRDLIAAGADPDDPAAGRGLCKGCHDRWTAREQPGGWHARM